MHGRDYRHRITSILHKQENNSWKFFGHFCKFCSIQSLIIVTEQYSFFKIPKKQEVSYRNSIYLNKAFDNFLFVLLTRSKLKRKRFVSEERTVAKIYHKNIKFPSGALLCS